MRIKRSSKNKGKDQIHLLNDEESSSCCSDNNLWKSADYKIQEQEPTAKSKLLSNLNKSGTFNVTNDEALWSSQNLKEQESAFKNLNRIEIYHKFSRLSFCFDIMLKLCEDTDIS